MSSVGCTRSSPVRSWILTIWRSCRSKASPPTAKRARKLGRSLFGVNDSASIAPPTLKNAHASLVEELRQLEDAVRACDEQRRVVAEAMHREERAWRASRKALKVSLAGRPAMYADHCTGQKSSSLTACCCV